MENLFERQNPKYIGGNKIEWTKILKAVSSKRILCECPTCWAAIERSAQNIWREKCRFCVAKYTRYNYIYWISRITIKNRICQWWTLNQSLWLEVRAIPKESFRNRELRWLSRQREMEHEEMESIAKKAEAKYDLSYKL